LERIGGVADGPHIHLLSGEDLRDSSSGELWRFIVTRDRITDGEFRLMAFQILSATTYLHENGVAHRDLKTENMLCGLPMITTSLGTAPTVKLSDFGTARVLSVEDQFGVTHQREGTVISIVNGQPKWLGTTQYIAPELLQAGFSTRVVRDNRYLGVYNTKCDVYSLGITFCFMLTKQMPYDSSRIEKISRFVMRGDTSVQCEDDMTRNNINEDTKKLILSMLHVDPFQRSSAKDLLSSNYFDTIRAEM
jgi:serine/threonine protein kinase